jgi:hypothetical protein
LVLLAQLPEEERAAIAPQAMCLAACVAPDRAFALRATTTDPFGNEKFLLDMVRHGHVAAAVDYLAQWSEDGEFPYHAAFRPSAARKTMTRAAIFSQWASSLAPSRRQHVALIRFAAAAVPVPLALAAGR